MLVKFTSCSFDIRICVITTPRMYLACTRCKHGDHKALFINALSQFLEEQLCTGVDSLRSKRFCAVREQKITGR